MRFLRTSLLRMGRKYALLLNTGSCVFGRYCVPVFAAGESYAGVYVPTLAARVAQGNKDKESNINLKGLMVRTVAPVLLRMYFDSLGGEAYCIAAVLPISVADGLCFVQVGNGCTGTEIGVCGNSDGMKLEKDFLAGVCCVHARIAVEEV